MIAQQIAGETIGCSVLVNDRGALTRRYFSIEVPVSAAPELPAVSAPTVALQDPSNKTVKVTLGIPALTNFNSNVMQLTLNVPGTDCENRSVDATPNQVICSNLAGNTSYSASLKVSYRNSRIIQSNISSVTSFKTEPLIPLTEALNRVSAEQKEGGAVAYVGDQVDCPTDKSVKKLVELSDSRTSYTICWPADALAAWDAGGRTWTNFLTKKKFNGPIPPQPILVTQEMETDFSGGITAKFLIPAVPGFDPNSMSMSLRVYRDTSGTWVGALPGATLTVQDLGPEMEYQVNLFIRCLTVCGPSSTGLELWGPDYILKTIKNT